MARRKKTKTRSNAKRGFPYRKTDVKAAEEGERVSRAQYYTRMHNIAKDILQNARKRYDDFDEASEYIDDQIRETADDIDVVIYTGKALNVLVQSDNWLAIEEDYGDNVADWPVDPGSGLTGIITAVARNAVTHDLMDYVGLDKDEYFTD